MRIDKKNFWAQLSAQSRRRKRPILCLAPMADVTDAAFRQMFAKYGKPDVLWTEFVSADGLCSEAGRKKLLLDLKFKNNEHPIVAQIFTARPENCYSAVKLIRKLGFDGADINMGCPDRKVEKQCAGAALIKNPELAREIIKAAKKAAGAMPVSIKTRIGYNTIETAPWIKVLLEMKPAAISVHWRTRQEMSDVPARWDEAKKVMKLAKGTGTLILGNGDIANLEEARAKAKEHGLDGIMVGRGAFGNPWFFNSKINISDISVKKRMEVMLEHAVLFDKLFHGQKNFAIMKKHFKAYASGFTGAKELRVKLMKADNVKDVKIVVNAFLKFHNTIIKQ